MPDLRFAPAGHYCAVFVTSDDGASSMMHEVAWNKALGMLPIEGRIALRLMREHGNLTRRQIALCYACADALETVPAPDA